MHEKLPASGHDRARIRWLAAAHLSALHPNCQDPKEIELVLEEMRRQLAYYYGEAEISLDQPERLFKVV